MFQNIIFIGGIHGVGKGTLCSKVRNLFEIEYLSASELIKWAEINSDPKNKLVTDIPSMQDCLIQELHHRVEPNHKYILDVHFCLFDRYGNVDQVPFSTFFQIDHVLIAVVIAEPEAIVQRLNDRDSKFYELQMIHQMQDEEISYGKSVSRRLNRPFLVVEGDEQVLVEAIKNI